MLAIALVAHVLTQGSGPVAPAETITTILASYLNPFLFLLVLTVVDFLTGVGSALKRGVFKWPVLFNFYRTTIGPLVLGWAAVAIVTESAVLLAVPAEWISWLAGTTVSGLYLGAVGALGISIVANLAEINGKPKTPPASA